VRVQNQLLCFQLDADEKERFCVTYCGQVSLSRHIFPVIVLTPVAVKKANPGRRKAPRKARYNLGLAQTDRPIPGVYRQRLPAAIHFPMKLRVAERPLDSHRQAHTDMSIPSAGVNVRLEVAR
jgi:hypothetical protein